MLAMATLRTLRIRAKKRREKWLFAASRFSFAKQLCLAFHLEAIRNPASVAKAAARHFRSPTKNETQTVMWL